VAVRRHDELFGLRRAHIGGDLSAEIRITPRPCGFGQFVGRVRDDKGEPVVGALVEAMGTQLAAWIWAG